MRGVKVSLAREGRRHGEPDPVHADAHQRGDLQQLGRMLQVALAKRVCTRARRRRAQNSMEAIEAKHRRSWLARMVRAEVRSATRSAGIP